MKVKTKMGIKTKPIKGIYEKMIRMDDVVVAMLLNKMFDCHEYPSDTCIRSVVLWYISLLPNVVVRLLSYV